MIGNELFWARRVKALKEACRVVYLVAASCMANCFSPPAHRRYQYRSRRSHGKNSYCSGFSGSQVSESRVEPSSCEVAVAVAVPVLQRQEAAQMAGRVVQNTFREIHIAPWPWSNELDYDFVSTISTRLLPFESHTLAVSPHADCAQESVFWSSCWLRRDWWLIRVTRGLCSALVAVHCAYTE